MTLEEFRQAVDAARSAHPGWFTLPADRIPTEEEIVFHQANLGVRLPQEYLDFIREFGGGDFAFVEVYSMDTASDLNVVRKNSASWLERDDFVAVSDNGTGDYYGFAVVDGQCSREVVLLDHETDTLSPTGHSDWFEFVAYNGLSP